VPKSNRGAINMKTFSYDPSKDSEFKDFSKELEKESDRGIAIICHAYIEDLLKALLKKRLIENKDFLNNLKKSISFNHILILCYITGIVTDEEKQEIEIINRIRNQFGHRRKVNKFCHTDIRGICNNLRVPKSIMDKMTTRKKFVSTAAYYVQMLNLKLKYTKKVKNIEVESRGLKMLDNLYI
jgi:hypothetical protein